jgi:hypothetical protein
MHSRVPVVDPFSLTPIAAGVTLLCTIMLGGCVPVLVGGLFYKSVKSNEEKAAFTTNFQKTNLEREKAKLQPLDWCSEAYKFDKGWATENPQCAERVKRYEAGEVAALEP